MGHVSAASEQKPGGTEGLSCGHPGRELPVCGGRTKPLESCVLEETKVGQVMVWAAGNLRTPAPTGEVGKHGALVTG